MSQKSVQSLVLPVFVGLLLPAAAAFATKGCKKDEPPPPMPSAAPTPTPSAPLVLVVEDAGPDVTDASDAGPKRNYGPAKPSGLRACCSALRQNAASAPPPTNMYLLTAAAHCDNLAAQGKTSAAGIAGMLKGAGMPAACR